MKLTRILQPIEIGGVKLRNRIVMPAMALSYAPFGSPVERLKDFYLERAKGGVGLVMVGGIPIYGLGSYRPALSKEEFVIAWRDFTDALHRNGAKVGVQLFHPGKFAFSSVTGEQSVSPSSIPSRFTGETPRELTVPEIESLVEDFAEMARVARDAGFDLVEYNCASGYLIREFLSPLCNERTDEYGMGDRHGLRFFLEIIERSSEKAGENYPLTCKLSAAEFLAGGYGLEQAKFFARELEKAGICAIMVVGGGHEVSVPLSNSIVPRGAFVYLAQAIKEEVTIPIVASARINDPFLAERILDAGKADLVAMGRALIADPEFVVKAEEGRLGDIAPCIACNQGCFDRAFAGQPVGCLVNARAGREKELGIAPAGMRKKVVVIGGGPAGMEAARVAAIRGHFVSLYEKADRLGGQVNLIAACPGRGEFAELVTYLSRQLEKQSVQVLLGREATPEVIAEEKPDAVIVATGALPTVPQIPGVDRENVVKAWDVLAGRATAGPRAVVIGGGAVGCDTAIFLAREWGIDDETAVFLAENEALDCREAVSLVNRGRKVTILEMAQRLGTDIGATTRWTVMRALKRLGVEVMTEVEAEEITDEGVKVTKGGETMLVETDTVVIAIGARPDSALCQQLKGTVAELYVIGDAKEVRKSTDAVREGFEVALQL